MSPKQEKWPVLLVGKTSKAGGGVVKKEGEFLVTWEKKGCNRFG